MRTEHADAPGYFVDADVFMGMHHEDAAVRRGCKAFFVRHLNDRVTMSLEQVGRCDDLVWRCPRALQDAYYPFMDRLHTDMAIHRVGYTKQDTDRAWRDPALEGFPPQRRLVLGQVKVAEKSNEIVAIPKLLDMLAIEGAIVTIDAIGCQREIASKIIDKKADYVLALKGNQGTLRDDVELFANEQKARDFKDTTVSQHKTVDGDHGRIETRRTTVFHDIGWLQERHNWPALKGLVMVESERQIDAKIETETRFYITSSTDQADKLGNVVRRHWSVESMHWLMDCLFRDDECRVRTEHAPANFTTIKHIAHNLLRRHPAKLSMTTKRLTAAWDEDFLVSLIS